MRDHAGLDPDKETTDMRLSQLIIVILLFALGACSQQATPPAASQPAPVAANRAGTADAPIAQATADTPAPTDTTASTASATPTAPGAAVDDHAAVNAAIDAALGEHAQYESLITTFQSAVAGSDKAGVAALVAYPFTAHIDGKAVAIANADAFVAHYDAIVTPAIARAITTQRYSELFVNYQGVMFGNGEAWISGICKDTACKDAQARVVAIQPVQ